MTPIHLATQAIIAELHRQAAISGCATEDNGTKVQVDGSFEVEPLARAVLLSIREPSEGMVASVDEEAGELAQWPIDQRAVWQFMIDAALEG